MTNEEYLAQLAEIHTMQIASEQAAAIKNLGKAYGSNVAAVKADLAAYRRSMRAATIKGWAQMLIRNGEDVMWCLENASLILQNHRDWVGRICFNEVSGAVELDGQPLQDSDVVSVLRWFNRMHQPCATKTVVWDAIYDVARQNSYNPIRDYLEGLEWDGVQRLPTMLYTYFGASDSKWHQAIGTRFMVSAVARALKPGCKVDTMLVLEGEQGLRKSSAISALFGEEYFGDDLPPLHTPDASQYLRGKWCVEKAELSQLRKTAWETTKAFMSRRVENYRKPYGREFIREPRMCIFVGSTNSSEYLADPTGSRRFWPCKCGVILLGAIIRDRDQLWAEATQLFKKGEQWWLTRGEEKLALEETGEREIADPWFDDVAAHVVGFQEVFINDILAVGLVLPVHQRHPSAMARVGAVLDKLGYERGKKIGSGPNRGKRPWRLKDPK